MPRKRRDLPPPADPIEASVEALRRATGESDDDWPDDLRDLGRNVRAQEGSADGTDPPRRKVRKQ
jgi:hypothetical protein